MRFAPEINIHTKTIIAATISLILCSGTVHGSVGETIDQNYLNEHGETEETGDTRYRIYFTSGDHSFDSINLPDFTPISRQNQYAILVKNGASLTITGDTCINSNTITKEGITPEGTLAITAGSKFDTSTGTINLAGNVKIHAVEDVGGIYGTNVLYSIIKGSEITVGNTETETELWAIAAKPDVISAKLGGAIALHSTKNRIVGNIDTLDVDFGTKGASVYAIFSGADSYWFGDEQTFQNIKNITITYIRQTLTINNTDDINKLLSRNYKDLLPAEIVNNSYIYNSVKTQIDQKLNELGFTDNETISESIDLVFENGAQWSYFGEEQIFNKIQSGAQVSITSTPKRISKITLNNGGIVNLYDEDLQNTWSNLKNEDGKSLSELWSDLATYQHDYVRIGDLKGNNGIFRLDLNSDDQSKSDMIFIESSSQEGGTSTHFIEPYRPGDLASVSNENRLSFALVADGADERVTFADKQNIYNESLYEYELEIGSEEVNESNSETLKDLVEDYYGKDKEGGTFTDFDINDYIGGTHWFINRLSISESAAAVGMRSVGFASYDAAVRMDRRDRRLQDAVFQDGSNDGLWVRLQYGEAGAESLYKADLTTIYLGYERATSPDNRFGVSFSYTDGSTDFMVIKGSGDLKRYEVSAYDTLTFGSHYLDFVGRLGMVENDFNTSSREGSIRTNGDFDQNYAAVSVEYGFNLKDKHNIFIEPQLQIQAAYLEDYEYRTNTGLRAEADSEVSVIGRAGLRFGKIFEGTNKTGQVYARADVLHQFTDGQDARFSDAQSTIDVTWGNSDTWATFGIGGYMNWNNNVSFQLDLERTAGGKTYDTWAVSGRMNYLF